MLSYLRKKDFTEYDHGYVYITNYRSVLRRFYLICEMLVQHPTSGASKGEARRVEQHST